MTKRKVLVTGVGGRSVGSGILYSLTRALDCGQYQRWEVLAADADPFSFGLYKVNQGIVLPLALAPDYLEKIAVVIKKHGIVALLPGTEIETDILARNIHLLGDVQLIANTQELIKLMMDKNYANEKLTELGIDSPFTTNLLDWEKIYDRCGFPLVVKPSKGTGGSKGVKLVVSEKEVQQYIQTIDPATTDHYLVQEYVGNGESEYTVSVLTDNNGNLIDSLILKRHLVGLSLLENRSYNGSSYCISTGYSQGFIVDDEKVRQYCEGLALKLSSKGPLNIQLRVDGERIVVFEIHARFSGTTPIRADVGFNEPDILLRNFLDGEKFDRIHYLRNVAAIRAFEHAIVPMEVYDDMRRTING